MMLTGAGVIFLYVLHLIELRFQLISYVESYATRSVIVGAYNMFFILMIMLAEPKLVLPERVRKGLLLLGLLAMGSYLLFYHDMIVESRNEFLEGVSTVTGFVFHYMLVGFLIASVVLSLAKLNREPDVKEATHDAHWWIFIPFFVFLASAELDHTVVLSGYSGAGSVQSLLSHNHKIGFPILWGVSAFLLIAIGLKKKIKALRIISLVLLLVTLVKLFFVDLRGISEGGKIAAFISLGILLLVVSFMYQRLKKLLLEDGSVGDTKEVV